MSFLKSTSDELADRFDDGESHPAPVRADRVAAGLLLDRALSAVPSFHEMVAAGSVAIVIEVPDTSFLALVTDRLQQVLLVPAKVTQDGGQTGSYLDRNAWRLLLLQRDGSERTHKPSVGNDAVADALGCGRAVIGIAAVPERVLPADLLRAADVRITVPPIDAGVIKTVIEQVTGRRLRQGLPDDLVQTLTLRDLCLAIRPGASAGRCLQRLRRMVTTAPKGGPRLADLHGVGAAKIWGEALATDLEAYRRGVLSWSAVDRGLLLYLSSRPDMRLPSCNWQP